MYAGIDFGTSSSSIGVWKKRQPVLIPLEEGNTRLPSALYTSRSSIAPEAIYIPELNKRTGVAKRDQTKLIRDRAKLISEIEEANRKTRAKELKKPKDMRDMEDMKKRLILIPIPEKELTDSQLENRERGIMRLESKEDAREKYEKQGISEALYADSEVFFGEEAIRHHIRYPRSGYFIKSPKSFLGANIQNNYIELYSEIITRILAFIKSKAEQHERAEIDNIVLGRPVTFHGTKGDEGNSQAIGILESAAIAAGFNNVEFLMEPIAAALDFERSISKDLVALVLDTGGGTTDCTMIKIGPSYKQLTNRNDSTLGYDGSRIGGIDLDIQLAMKKIMPCFGKDTLLNSGLPIPNALFWNPIAINDVPAQAEYRLEKAEREVEEYYSRSTDKIKHDRLRRVYKNKLGTRLNRSAELAKIHLSDRDLINLPLKYIETELVIPISRQDLKESIRQKLDGFISLMKEVEKQASVKPDIVYVTGGTAKSPVVEEFIRSHYGDVEIVVGDLFGSVTSGLTSWAQRIYQ